MYWEKIIKSPLLLSVSKELHSICNFSLQFKFFPFTWVGRRIRYHVWWWSHRCRSGHRQTFETRQSGETGKGLGRKIGGGGEKRRRQSGRPSGRHCEKEIVVSGAGRRNDRTERKREERKGEWAWRERGWECNMAEEDKMAKATGGGNTYDFRSTHLYIHVIRTCYVKVSKAEKKGM